MNKLYAWLARKSPGLKTKLQQAGIYDSPEGYVKKTVFNSVLLALGICFILFMFLMLPIVFLFVPVIVPLLYFYFMGYVDVKIEQIKKDIDREIIYAGRFLIIEIESGVPLYDAIYNIEKNYRIIGAYFGDIVNKVYLGTSLEDAINETMLITPSNNLRKILWQMLNSIKTGGDVATSLNSVIDQIMKEQKISVQDYGKKLNPLAMFYMMVAIIVPSLGVTMLVVLATFLGLQIGLPILLVIACLLGFVQFMFLSIIKSARPSISS
ncbi:MAG: type II secretion system F family protein [Candidatus Woesearchaeota archaeon]